MIKNSPQETLIFPLVGRYKASEKWPECFGDSHSKRIIKDFGEEILKKDMGSFPAITYGLRYNINVYLAKKYIEKHPKATVVNIGAGLDSLFDDIDNGLITYISLDFEEVIERRNQYFETTDRNYNIAASMTDIKWMDKVPFSKENGIIFLAAGVIYYIDVEEVKEVVKQMSKRFKGGVFTFDMESPKYIKMSERMVKKKGVSDAPMIFLLENPYEIKSWSDDIKSVKIIKDFRKGTPNYKKLPFLYNFMFKMMNRKDNMYQLIINF